MQDVDYIFAMYHKTYACRVGPLSALIQGEGEPQEDSEGDMQTFSLNLKTKRKKGLSLPRSSLHLSLRQWMLNERLSKSYLAFSHHIQFDFGPKVG